MLLAAALVCAGILLWTEASGITRILVTSAPGVVTSSFRGPTYIGDAAGGGTDYVALDVRIVYTVRGTRYVLHTQWQDDFWSSNDNFEWLVHRLARGKSIDVLYLRFAPRIARPDVPVTWGVVFAVVIGGAILVAMWSGHRLIRRSKESH
jgi:hypothetical protein